jgi:hypothetical protein
MRRISIIYVVVCLMLISGCNYCCWGKRISEKNCPTDIRQTHKWCFGEDALFHYPCGPKAEFYGYQPTCWREWPASGAAWRDMYCQPAATAAPTVEFQPPHESGPVIVPDTELPEPMPTAPVTPLPPSPQSPTVPSQSPTVLPQSPTSPPQSPTPDSASGNSSLEFLAPQENGPSGQPGTTVPDAAPNDFPALDQAPAPQELPEMEGNIGRPLKESLWYPEERELMQSVHLRSGETVQPAYYRAQGDAPPESAEQPAQPEIRRLPPI